MIITLHLNEYEAKVVRKALQRVQPLVLVSAAEGADKAYQSVTTLMKRIDAAYRAGTEVRDALSIEE